MSGSEPEPSPVKSDLDECSTTGTPTQSHNLHPKPPSSRSSSTPHSRRTSTSPPKESSKSSSPHVKPDLEDGTDAEIVLKVEPGQPPKLSRSLAKKQPSRAPPTYTDLPDATPDATKTFEVIPNCLYLNKGFGIADEIFDCDCTEDWDSVEHVNHACGEDSNCANRAIKMECSGDCRCGQACQNQRFQRQLFADVAVIKTEKKGFGLRANASLRADQFIFEYIGEVIGEGTFHKRMTQYHNEGIKHFYFMSLSRREFIDATKKGNLGRFCNHSCSPNCYVDKWIVGNRWCMGIFAKRRIAAGEELTFDYNVDRYGADAQPCYCGEPNCAGVIGGKTQSDTHSKLPLSTIEALGFEDGRDWDRAVSKKSRKKRVDEDDEEYVDSVQPKGLDQKAVENFLASLLRCDEKWIAVKLLARLQRCDDEITLNRVVTMHGYRVIDSSLSKWMDDDEVVGQLLGILHKLPRLTRNKIDKAKIDITVKKVVDDKDGRIRESAERLLADWDQLKMEYRIPKLERTNAAQRPERFSRRRTPSPEIRKAMRKPSPPPKSPRHDPAIPTGPKAGPPPRAPLGPKSQTFRRQFPSTFGPPSAVAPSLPPGWFQATNENGRTYFYSATGDTSWDKPTIPAAPPPPPPSRAVAKQKELDDFLNSIDKAPNPKAQKAESATPNRPSSTPKTEHRTGDSKWKDFPERKKMTIYENTIFPHVTHIVNKYKGKFEKHQLKRYAQESAKGFVSSEFKHGKVDDPTRISNRKQNQVKEYVQKYFEKAMKKKRADEESQRRKHGKHDKDEKRDKHHDSKVPSSKPEAATPEVSSPKKPESESMSRNNSISESGPMSRNDSISGSSSPQGTKRKFDLEVDTTRPGVESPNFEHYESPRKMARTASGSSIRKSSLSHQLDGTSDFIDSPMMDVDSPSNAASPSFQSHETPSELHTPASSTAHGLNSGMVSLDMNKVHQMEMKMNSRAMSQDTGDDPMDSDNKPKYAGNEDPRNAAKRRMGLAGKN